MTADQIAAFCLQLPGAREDLKWGSNRVFSVAGNKMFARSTASICGLPQKSKRVCKSLPHKDFSSL